jgi:phosphoribosylformylglycinamidine (FGAM) synthase-like enzyme
VGARPTGGAPPPQPDLAAEMRLADVLESSSRDRLLGAAHDLSDGGLAQCLVEMSLASGHGARVTLPDGDVFTALFSESVARVVVAVDEEYADAVLSRCADHGVPAIRIGQVGGDSLEVAGLFTIALGELRATSDATLPALFG